MDQYFNFEEHNEGAAVLDLLAEDTTERDEDAQLEESKPSLDLLADYVTETDKEDKQPEEPKHYESSTSFDLSIEYAMENDEDEWFKESEYYEDVMSNLLTEYAVYEKYEDEPSFVYESDSDHNTIAEGIKRINELRLEQVNLIARRSNVMKMLIELYEKDLCKTDVPTIEGTEDEVEEIYNKLLLEFHKKKMMALERKRILLEEVNQNIKILRSKHNECAAISAIQYDLEFKSTVGLVNSKTGKQLTDKDVEKILKTYKLKNQQLYKFRSKYITVKNKCKQLLKDINKLESNKINITEYLKISADNNKLKQLIEYKDKEIATDRNTLIKTLDVITNISKRMDDLMINKEKGEAKLKEIKEQWRRNVNAKVHNQNVLNLQKRNQRSDLFTENPLLLIDYNACVVKADANKATVAKLRQKLTDCNEKIDKLQKAYETAKKNKNGKVLQ